MRTLQIVVSLVTIVGSADQAAGQDPRIAEGQQAVREILEKVGGELRSIDEMLLQASRPADRGAAGRRDATELLERSDEAQTRVADGIDELLKEIEKRQGEGC